MRSEGEIFNSPDLTLSFSKCLSLFLPFVLCEFLQSDFLQETRCHILTYWEGGMGQNSQVPLFQGGMTVSSNWQKPLHNWPICSFLDLLANKVKLPGPCFMDTHYILAAHYYGQLSLSPALTFSLNSTSFIRTLSMAPSVSVLCINGVWLYLFPLFKIKCTAVP